MSKAQFSINLHLLFSMALGAAACSGGPYQAPMGAVLSVPSDVNLAPSQAYVLADSIGSIVIGDVIVYDESTGEPYNNVSVSVITGASGLYVLPEMAMKMADYPSPPDGVETTEDVEAECDTDGNGVIDSDADDWCSWWWGMDGGEYYYQLTGEYASGDTNYAPNQMIAGTNSNGYLTFYLFIDQMPAQDEDGNSTLTDVSQVSDWYAVDVTISIGVDSQSFTVAVTSN